jgi:hypothetical protein
LPPEGREELRNTLDLAIPLARIYLARGEVAAAASLVEPIVALKASADIQLRTVAALASALLLRARGECEGAARVAETATAGRAAGIRLYADEGFVEAVEALVALGAVDRAERILAAIDELPPGEHSRFMDAHHARLSGRLRSQVGAGGSAERFTRASALFREVAMPFWLGVSLLEHGESLANGEADAHAEPLLAEARAIFERLEARPWLERVARVAAALPDAATAATP